MQADAASKAVEKETAPEPEPAAAAVASDKPAVQVSAKVVKELREKSGAGMMDCKKVAPTAWGVLVAFAFILNTCANALFIILISCP